MKNKLLLILSMFLMVIFCGCSSKESKIPEKILKVETISKSQIKVTNVTDKSLHNVNIIIYAVNLIGKSIDINNLDKRDIIYKNNISKLDSKKIKNINFNLTKTSKEVRIYIKGYYEKTNKFIIDGPLYSK